MVIDKEEEIKNKLSSIRKINYSEHFERERLPYRGNVTKELIEKHINNPEGLIAFEHQEDAYEGEKYALLFEKSSKYDLKVVVSINNKYLNVVTAHIQSKRKRDKFKKGFNR